MGHIELARWADAILIAPATADFISQLNHGSANQLLTTLCLAHNGIKAIAPAMNQAMYHNASCQENLAELKTKGMHIFGPDEGLQACGDIGYGRMLEPINIAQMLANCFESCLLSGLSLSITAGPTREALDPVRYISNHSSGKMGFALARAASEAGAKVTLIAGPVNLSTPERVTRIDVISADDMLAASLKAAEHSDIFIACAAVADYKPAIASKQKIKKFNDEISLTLIKNSDIVATVAQQFKPLFTVGFAAETENLLQHAKFKLKKKNLNMIIANNVADSRIGFNSDDNAVTIITANSQEPLDIQNKQRLAGEIIARIAKQYQ